YGPISAETVTTSSTIRPAMANGSRRTLRIRRTNTDARTRRFTTGASAAAAEPVPAAERLGLLTAMAQPRVEVGVGDVHQQVGPHDDGGTKQDHRLNQRQIVVRQRTDPELADPRPREDGLDDDRVPGQQLGRFEAAERDDRNTG